MKKRQRKRPAETHAGDTDHGQGQIEDAPEFEGSRGDHIDSPSDQLGGYQLSRVDNDEAE